MRNDYAVAGLNSPACTFAPHVVSQSLPRKSSTRPSGSVEAVRNLEHRQRYAALRPGPRLVAAAGGAPHEIARLARAFVAMKRALEHQGLLDHDVLMVREASLPAPF